MRNNYRIVFYWSEADNCLISVVPALPGCMSDGRDVEELQRNTDQVIDEWIETAKAIGRPIPAEDGNEELISSYPKVEETAAYIVSRIDERMTAYQLEKIVYYTQAYSLAWCGHWEHGPVCRDLWKRHQGRRIVTISDFPYPHEFTESEKKILDSVIDVYGNFNGDELEVLTHREDPWIITRGNLKSFQPDDKIIDESLMRDYYKLNA